MHVSELLECMILFISYKALGEVGRIVRIDRDGDVRVKVKARVWIFNPVVCSPVEDPAVKDKVPDLSKSELSSEKGDSLALSRELDGYYFRINVAKNSFLKS